METNNSKPTNGFDKRPEDINRKGRPKKSDAFATLLETELNKEYEVLEDGQTIKKRAIDIIIKRAIAEAVKGDNNARDFLLDRYLGRPRQAIDIDSEGESNPIVEGINALTEAIKGKGESQVENKTDSDNTDGNNVKPETN